MIPDQQYIEGLKLCIPRESGDDPDTYDYVAVKLMYSPRERG